MGQKGGFHSIGGYEVKFGFYNAVIKKVLLLIFRHIRRKVFFLESHFLAKQHLSHFIGVGHRKFLFLLSLLNPRDCLREEASPFPEKEIPMGIIKIRI